MPRKPSHKHRRKKATTRRAAKAKAADKAKARAGTRTMAKAMQRTRTMPVHEITDANALYDLVCSKEGRLDKELEFDACMALARKHNRLRHHNCDCFQQGTPMADIEAQLRARADRRERAMRKARAGANEAPKTRAASPGDAGARGGRHASARAKRPKLAGRRG